jgi:hypothetical protein
MIDRNYHPNAVSLDNSFITQIEELLEEIRDNFDEMNERT